MSGKLWPKLIRDFGTVIIAFVLAIVLFYVLRRIDPAATVDGLANLFHAVQMLIIGFASASAAGAICWLLFGMPGRSETKTDLDEASLGLIIYYIGQRITWLIVFWLLFSRSVGQ